VNDFSANKLQISTQLPLRMVLKTVYRR